MAQWFAYLLPVPAARVQFPPLNVVEINQWPWLEDLKMLIKSVLNWIVASQCYKKGFTSQVKAFG